MTHVLIKRGNLDTDTVLMIRRPREKSAVYKPRRKTQE